MNAKELGEMVGVSDQAIRNYELGLREPKPAVVTQLEDIFGLRDRELADELVAAGAAAEEAKRILRDRKESADKAEVRRHNEMLKAMRELTEAIAALRADLRDRS